jgi:hypothetical protein
MLLTFRITVNKSLESFCFGSCFPEGPPLWSSGQSSWLQNQRPGFDSRHYLELVGLERGPFSLVSTTEELLGRKSIVSGLENRNYGRRDPSRWPRGTLYPQRLALTSPTSGGRSVGIVRSRTQTTEFVVPRWSVRTAGVNERLAWKRERQRECHLKHT